MPLLAVPPAVQALRIQLCSFLIVLAVALPVSALTALQPTVLDAVLLQGVLAAAISRWCAMAPRWLLIQLVFPVALIAFQALHLPSWLFLVGFLALAGIYWTTFRTQVPFYPSGRRAWKAAAAQLPQDRPLRFIDIGSGFGGLVLHLARQRPESSIGGVELAPLPWLASRLVARLASSSAYFVWGDYRDLDFSSYDVIFAYLSPAAMPALWQKACAEMKKGALLLSYEFPIPGASPDIAVRNAGAGVTLYGWRF